MRLIFLLKLSFICFDNLLRFIAGMSNFQPINNRFDLSPWYKEIFYHKQTFLGLRKVGRSTCLYMIYLAYLFIDNYYSYP
jgi:hypothetical protein